MKNWIKSNWKIVIKTLITIFVVIALGTGGFLSYVGFIGILMYLKTYLFELYVPFVLLIIGVVILLFSSLILKNKLKI